MAGVDYRQLQAPEQINTDLPNSGAAARAAELGSVFKEFEGISNEYLTKAQTEAGSLAGAAAGATGNPKYKEGLARFSAYSQAYNNAATGAYAVQAEAQADDAAARLRVQANNDPAHFNTTYSAVRDAVLKNAPAEAVPMLTQLYNKRLAAGIAALSGDQAAQQQQLQRSAYDDGVARLTSRVAILQGSANAQDQLQAMDEHVKLSALIDGGVNAGLYSKAEAQAMHVNSMKTITAQVFQTQVDRELERPDGDVITLLENFRKAHTDNLANPNEPPILSEQEYQKLYADATTRVREENMLIAMNKREGKTAEQLRWEAGDVAYTSMFLSGKLTAHQLDLAVLNSDVKPERATGLYAMMLNGPQVAKSDPHALLKLHTDPLLLDKTIAEVAATPGINPLDALKAWDEIQKRRNSWEGTQQSKQAVSSISAALKIPPGTPAAALSEVQLKAYTDAHQEYISIVNGLKPSEQQNGASLNSAAQTAIRHAQQREAAAGEAGQIAARQRFIAAHGPGSVEPADKDAYAARLKHYDDLIRQLGAAAKGQ